MHTVSGESRRGPARWLIAEWQWPCAGTVTAIVLLALVPVFAGATSLALTLTFVLLPVYMLHQLEEHHRDRFRREINAQLGGGRELLTRPVVFWINVGGVWIAYLVWLWLASEAALALGLLPAYLTGVNAVIHAGGALATRRYNAGLWTALALMLPVAVWAAIEISAAAGAGLGHHLVALAYAVATHAAIVIHVAVRRARLPAASAPAGAVASGGER